MNYVVIDIGCLECGYPSELVKLTDEEGARAMGANLRQEMGDADWSGDGLLVAFPIPVEMTVALSETLARKAAEQGELMGQ